MPSTFAFANVTRGTTFDVRRSSLAINDARPCQLATLSGTLDDGLGSLVLEAEDEISLTETPAGGSPVVIFAGDVTRRARSDHGGITGPRVYQFTAQDFTARLGDDVVTEARNIQESAAARVAWLMGFSDRGLTFASVEAIGDLVDPFDYTGMSVAAGLSQVAQLVNAIFYVDYAKDLHFFQTENRPAPFDLVRPATPPTSYPYRDFALEDATPDLAHRVFVKGDGVAVWRTIVGAPSAPTRQSRSVSDNNVKTVADAEALGDALLAKWSDPALRGSLTVYQPGLQGGMQIRITNPAWSIDDTFVITSVAMSLFAPGRAVYKVGFAKHYLCGPTQASFAGAATSLPVQITNEVAQQFADLSLAGANLIRNSSFESTSDWTQGSLWAAGYASANPYDQAKTARTAPTGSNTGELVTTAFINVDRTADWWFSFWSFLSARTAGTARCRVREYDSGGSLLQSTDIDLTAAEAAWTRHSLHFGPTVTDTRLAFHASTAKLKIALYATGSPTLTWEVDAFQLERSSVLTSYAPAPSELIDGSITTEKMADLAITLAKLADASVANSKLVDAAVDAVKLANDAVSAAKIQAGAVLTAKLADNAVSLAKLAALSVDTSKLVDGSVASAKIADLAITQAKIAASAVGTTQLVDGAVLAAKLADNSVALAKLAANSVDTSKIVDDAINAAKIAAAAVGSLELGSGAVTTAKIAAGAVTATELADSAVTTAKFAAGIRPVAIVGALPTLPDALYPIGSVVFLTTDKKLYRNDANAWVKNVDGADLVADSVTSAGIAASAVTSSELAALAVTTAKIAAGAVTATEIADAAVGVAKFAAGLRPVEILGALPAAGTQGRTVLLTTDNKLYRDTGAAWTAAVPATDLTGQLTDAQIAAVAAAKVTGQITGTQITDGSITTAKIAAGAVTAATIAADTITAAQIAAGAISSSELAAGAVVAGKIAAGTIVAADIAADTITAGQIAAGAIATSELAAGAVTTAKIYAGAVTATEIAAGAITASKLLVTVGGGNLLPDSGFEDTTNGTVGWFDYDGGAFLTFDTSIKYGGARSAKVTYVPGGNNYFRTGAPAWNPIPASISGKVVTVSFYARATSGAPAVWSAFLVNSDYHALGTIYPTTTWTRYFWTFTPGGTGDYYLGFGGSTDAANPIYYDNIQIEVGDVATAYAPKTSELLPGTIVASMIAADTITAAQIAAGAIATSELLAGSVTTAKIAALNVTASEVAAGAIVAGKIAAGTIVAADIAADTITAGQIAAGAIATSELAAGSVTAAKIAAGTITATEIAADTITAAVIAAGTITTTQIATDTITAGNIAANAVSTSELNAAAVTTAKIAAGNVTATEIAAGAVTTAKIYAGAVTANEIAAGAITAAKLSVTMGGGNLLKDSGFEDTSNATAGWGGAIGCTLSFDTSIKYGGARSAKVTYAAGADHYAINGEPTSWIPAALLAGKSVTVSFYARSLSAGVPYVDGPALMGLPSYSNYTGLAPFVPTTTWTRYSGTVVPAAGATEDWVFILRTSTDAANPIYYDNIQIEVGDVATAYAPAVTELLPGTIVATMIAADAITAGQIAASAISTSELAAGAVTAAKITAGTITTTEIAALTIVAGNIANDTLTSNQIAAGAITASEIAANVITAAKIQAATITTTEIAADTIAASNIAANAITASEILAGAVTTAKIAAGNVTATEIAAGAIDATKIAANAIVAGKIAAGAIGTADFSATASISLVSNAGSTVVINSSGITITDGALSIEDEFGKVTLGASGFAGSWTDFIRLGLYNARFADLTVGALTIGRAATLPYWTTQKYSGNPIFTGVSGGGVKITFAALNDQAGLVADLVPVRPGSTMEAGYCYKANRAAGTMLIEGYIYWLKADGSNSSSPYTYWSALPITSSVTTLQWFLNSVVVPEDAVQAQFVPYVKETGTHNAANSVTFYGTKLIDVPANIASGWRFGESATAAVSSSGTIHNYDPGNIDSTVVYQIATSTGLTLTGLVAPTQPWRLVVLFNYTGSTITLRDQNTNSTAANRFILPNSVDLVVRLGGSVILFYSGADQRWHALEK